MGQVRRANSIAELLEAIDERRAAGWATERILGLLADESHARRLARARAARALMLPLPASEVVLEVVRRSRLWPSEKRGVARELAAHFLDGIDAGSDASALADAFGDRRTAARLIRRAKKRNRSLAWKAVHRAAMLVNTLIVLLICAHLVLTLRLLLSTTRVARDHLAELNAPVAALPEEQRAWPLYREALLALDGPLGDYDFAEVHANDERFAALHERVSRSAAALQRLREAAARPALGAILNHRPDEALAQQLGGKHRAAATEPVAAAPASDTPLVGVNLPQLSALREAARWFVLDFWLAADAGDGARATAALTALLGAAEHAGQVPFVLGDMVSFSLVLRASDLIGRLTAERPELLSDDQYVQLSHKLAAVGGGGRFRLHLDGERRTFEDIVQRIYTDDGKGDGVLALDAARTAMLLQTGVEPRSRATDYIFAPAYGAILAGRREAVGKYNELMNLQEAWDAQPLWERRGPAPETEIRAAEGTWWYRTRYLPVFVLLPSLTGCSRGAEFATQERDVASVAIALTLYHRRHGEWPPTLDVLTPLLLPAVPVDRYDGWPLKYRVADGRPLLYSVGVDRDDDGGRLPAGRNGNLLARQWPLGPSNQPREDPDAGVTPPDGDWLIWPPATRESQAQ